MRRAAGKKTWIKLYPLQCLQGSIRWQLDSAERGVWYDLLNLAAIQPTPGSISDSDMRPVPHQFIAHQLNIPVELLETTLQKCGKEGRIKENNTGLHIVHWEVYQAEYQRQEKLPNKECELIFDHWNQQGIMTHKKLPDDMRLAIARSLKTYTIDEIKAAISNYAEILKGQEYFFKYKWTLRDFLKRGIEKFIDLGVAKSNFRRDKNGTARNPRELPETYTPTPDYPELRE